MSRAIDRLENNPLRDKAINDTVRAINAYTQWKGEEKGLQLLRTAARRNPYYSRKILAIKSALAFGEEIMTTSDRYPIYPWIIGRDSLWFGKTRRNYRTREFLGRISLNRLISHPNQTSQEERRWIVQMHGFEDAKAINSTIRKLTSGRYEDISNRRSVTAIFSPRGLQLGPRYIKTHPMPKL